MSKHVTITNLSISFGSNTYIEKFSTHIQSNARIGIIGRNGSGKSSLLSAIASNTHTNMSIAYLMQSIDVNNAQSHGEHLISRIAELIRSEPDVLLLDEPTNHLDRKNREYLFRMLDAFSGTFIFVSHDPQMLHRCADEIWHVTHGMVQIHRCKYDDYIAQQEMSRKRLDHEISCLNKEKKSIHNSLMQEQERAAKSRRHGQKSIDNKKWPTVRSKTKFGRGNTTAVSKQSDLDKKRDDLHNKIDEIDVVKVMKPTFHLECERVTDDVILSVNDGACGYLDNIVLDDVYLTVRANSRVAIEGPNGSGKSTLFKAIMSDNSVMRRGDWYLKNGLRIGFLDQNYSNISNHTCTVFEVIAEVVPEWSMRKIREHLNGFLFQKNDEVIKDVSQLSGGERLRLSLAKIAVKSPELLVLDEVTNNVDIETKRYIVQALNEYNGAILVVSHDDDFIRSIKIKEVVTL